MHQYISSRSASIKAIIDLDSVIFAAGFAVQKARYLARVIDGGAPLDGGILFDSKKEYTTWLKASGLEESKITLEKQVTVEPVTHAYQAFDYLMGSILTSDDIIIDDWDAYLSGADNYRKLMPTNPVYKGNRDPNHGPVHEEALREYAVSKYGALVINGMEADDACGIAQCAAEPESTILISVDKDLNMIPGWHYNYQKKTRYFIYEDEATRFFWTQMVTGDTADNIKGIYGIGPVKAAAMLDGVALEDLESVVWDAYLQEFEDDAERMYRQNQELLWILREPLTT